MLNRKCHGGPAQPCYYIHDGCFAPRSELAGFLSAELAAEVEACWRTASSTLAGRVLVIDLNRLTGAGEPGRQLLQWYEPGAHFLITSSTHSDVLIESITGHPTLRASETAPTKSARSLFIGATPAAVALALILLIDAWGPGSSRSLGAATATRARVLHSQLKNGSFVFNLRSPKAGASFAEGRR